jgi:hypothetical protein
LSASHGATNPLLLRRFQRKEVDFFGLKVIASQQIDSSCQKVLLNQSFSVCLRRLLWIPLATSDRDSSRSPEIHGTATILHQ